MTRSTQEHESLTLYLASSIHEIKNAFARLQYLNDEFVSTLPEEHINNLQRTQIQLEAKQISNQLSQLLITYKNKETHYHANPDSVIIEDYLEEIHLRHQETLALLNIALTLDPEPRLVATFDEHLMTNAIDTLIYNAIQAKATALKVSIHTNEPFIEINVQDNGPGFTQDVIDALNNDQAFDNHGSSTGLGLMFARRICQMHQTKHLSGHAQFSNNSPLGGACVTLSIPI